MVTEPSVFELSRFDCKCHVPTGKTVANEIIAFIVLLIEGPVLLIEGFLLRYDGSSHR